MSIQDVYNYFTSRYKILLCRIKALEDAPSSGADGNGIYDGSGNVPDNTVTTLDGSFQIIGTGADREFYVEVGDGVDDLTQIDMTPTDMTIGHAGSANSSQIIFSSLSGLSMQEVVGVNTYRVEIDTGGDIDIIASNNIEMDGVVIIDDYILIDSTPAANTTVKGITAQFTANENHGFGDAVFINSTSEAQLGDASVSGTSYCIGMCTATVTTGNTGTYLLQGFARNDTWNWTVGRPIFLSLTGTTTNTLTQTKPSATGEMVQLLAWAVTADIIYWNPQLVQVENA